MFFVAIDPYNKKDLTQKSSKFENNRTTRS